MIQKRKIIAVVVVSVCVVSILIAQSPGDIIGTTYYDLQASGSFGQRLRVDDSLYAHITWMKMNHAQSLRYVAWNARLSNGVYYGETQASPSWSGFVQLDITDDNRTVIVYHFDDQVWIDIDDGQCWGSFGNNTGSVGGSENLWPIIAVKGDNIVVVTGNAEPPGEFKHHRFLSTDLGMTWTYQGEIDSVPCLSHFVRSSPHSNKIVHAWTQSIALEYTGQLLSQAALDVVYQLSSNGGVTWSPPVNITNYQAPGTMVNGDSTHWAYCDVNGLFDNSDNLHLAWGVHMGWKHGDTIYYRDRAKIMHWDEVTDTITTVNSPSIYYNEPDGWWLDTDPGLPTGASGACRLPADQPQLISGNNNMLYCLWHGNDDTTDVSAGGYFNGEFYGAYSTDNGITWSDYVNLTNTRSPGAGPGDCFDEDYMTANPFTANDSIYLTYVEDKDAGAAPQGEGTYTENPVRSWVFSRSRITGLEEHHSNEPSGLSLEIAPNPFVKLTNISLSRGQSAESMELKIYDASGRMVRQWDDPTIRLSDAVQWNGTDQRSTPLPAGIYFVTLKSGDKASIVKVVKLH